MRQAAFFPPDPSSYDATLPNVWIEMGEGGVRRVPAFHVSAPARDNFTVLFSHGNGEDMGERADWAARFSERLGTDVMIYDYAGYGLNRPGLPSEEDCYADLTACYRYLTVDRKIPSKRIVLMGKSIGSGPTIHLASLLCSSDHPELDTERGALGGVIIESGMTSCVRVVSNLIALLPFTDMFQNVAKIGRVTVPTFIIHGERDHVVPFAHGQALFDRLPPEAKWRFLPLVVSRAFFRSLTLSHQPEARHNDVERLCHETVYRQLAEYFAFLGARTG